MNHPFPDRFLHQNGGPKSVTSSSEQGSLSPPYSNQSPPYSVQSSMVLSPQGYLSKYFINLSLIFVFNALMFPTLGSPSRHNLPNSPQTNSSAMRHTPQSNLMDGNSNGSVHPHHQMNFDYNHQNGLELAGFCSPQGKFKLYTY